MDIDTRKKLEPAIRWDDIDTVLLDMDGTLLDKHFDDYFWEQYVPEHYSLQHDLTVAEARQELLQWYRKHENTLAWTDLNHWSRELGLDIPALKIKVEHLIDVHPFVVDFLRFLKRAGKRLYLVTNAHPKTLAIKLKKTHIGPWFERIVCADELGLAKEQIAFWERLERTLGYDPARTLLADDTEKVLVTARDYGMGHLIFVARPSSRKAVSYSGIFPSIEFFNELIPE